MIFVTYTCEKCHEAFERAEKKGGYRFCSQKCANQHALKLGREELLPFAEIGALNGYMAKRLEVSRCTVRRALIEHDLYRLWASRRYLKCASPTVGPTSAITASSETTSQFVALVAPTA
jgi:hypothetical protein